MSLETVSFVWRSSEVIDECGDSYVVVFVTEVAAEIAGKTAGNAKVSPIRLLELLNGSKGTLSSLKMWSCCDVPL